MDKEQREEKIIELYNEGYPYREIEEAIGVGRRGTRSLINKLKAEGKLSDRPMPRNRMKQIEKRSVLIDNIIEAMVRDGKDIDTIIKESGYSESCIRKHISKMQKEGRISVVKKVKKERKPHSVGFKKKVRSGYTINDNPIKCNCTVSNTCVFGCKRPCKDDQKCRFFECTGVLRSTICPPTACTVYEKVTRENRRRGAK